METPNSKIIYPTVPRGEEDPGARINVMIDIFNAGLASSRALGGRIDRGLFHEIWTAYYLVRNHKIKHGSQISRPLTAAEKPHMKGDSQMILVPMQGHFKRELDMVYTESGKPFIVEAKNTKQADASQLKANIHLAGQVGGGVVYALGQKDGQQRAITDAYQRLSTEQNLPPLDFIQIPERVADIFSDEGRPLNLISVSTLEQITRFQLKEITGEFDEDGFNLSV